MRNDANNVAAQAGDEPIRAAFIAAFPKAVWDEKNQSFNEQMYNYAFVGFKTAQVSPRATADVERDAKRQAERVERLVRAAKVYTFNYLQDEHEEAELCTCGPKQHAELVELFAALAAIATTKPGA